MEETKTIFVQSNEEWDDAYDKFESMFDEPRDEERRRRPSVASLVLLFFVLAVILGCAAWVAVNYG